jgi:hypothetical protein
MCDNLGFSKQKFPNSNRQAVVWPIPLLWVAVGAGEEAQTAFWQGT